MQDFDEARDERLKVDRTFKFGGQMFTRKPGVKPEVMYAYEDMDATVKASEGHQIVLDLIFAFVEREGHDRLREVIDQDDHPVTVSDLRALLNWLISETARRPTTAPSPSTDGRETTGTNSTDPPSIAPAEASAA